jgi:hypothetical protein
MAESTRTPAPQSEKSIADLVVDAFAHDEARLRSELLDRERDFVAYRELAQEAMAALATETARRRHYQRLYYALLKERQQQGGGR